jgi:molybdopterin molybdotransferase
VQQACGDALRADAIITSGGVSVGDADYTRDVMQRAGEVSFWSLAFKPGRPMAFGKVSGGPRRALLFGLPGNPVAVMVIFYALVQEALLALMGARVDPVPVIDVVCDSKIHKAVGRTEFVRGCASRGRDGWHVRPTGAQGSGILRSMSEANCLIVLDHDRGPVASGDIVGVWLFDGLI